MPELDDLLEFVPEDKREAFKAKGAGYVRLTDDVALAHVTASQSLRDKVSQPVAAAALKNFQELKLPEMLKAEAEKVRAEFKPKDETPEQKELREMREWKKQVEAEKVAEARKDALRKKAAEMKYDPLKAERLYALGDDAETVLAELAKDVADRDAKIAELEAKIKYGDKAPPAGTPSANSITMDAFEKMDAKAKAAFMAKPGATIRD